MSKFSRITDSLYHKITDMKPYKRGELMILESQLEDHPESNVSYVAAFPKQVIQVNGDKVTWRRGDTTVLEERRENTWHLFDQFCDDAGWAFGYLGYDVQAPGTPEGHMQNRRIYEAPDLWFMDPGLLFKIDKYGVKQLRGEPITITPENNREGLYQIGDLSCGVTRESFLSAIDEIRNLIAEGDFYELNFSYPIVAEFEGDSFGLYRNMRRVNPVPFACYAELDAVSICCASPERFLRKEGQRVFSEPIKGTAARGANEAEDAAFKLELKSEKNEAENLMIVDLVRHDLSRVCKPGSINVSKLFEVQTFSTVHQLISRVEGRVNSDLRVGEIIRACFPMGSMTGAPKRRVMQRISELESFRRGIYSGAIGYVTPDHDFDFNVVIRSAIIQNERLCYPVGGAITSDSDPAKEWEETQVKAGVLKAVQKLQNVK